MTPSTDIQTYLEQCQRRALLCGVGGLGLCVLGALLQPAQFFHSYLLAYLFWVSLALGCLALLMLHHLVRGAWGTLILRLLEAGARTLPLMGVAFVPLLFGLGSLYAWARPEAVAGDTLLQHKSPYLNVPFFVLRTAAYFAIWIVLSTCLTRWSQQLDQAATPAAAQVLLRRLRRLSGPGLGLYVLTVTFAAVDWAMSLEPYWYSTIYGMVFLIGQLLMALASAIVILVVFARFDPFAAVVTPAPVHDLGNLLLAFVLLWAYLAFSQFLIIWSANLPEEVPWYLHRMRGGWEWVGVVLLVCHFAVPFGLLLARSMKRRLQTLATIASGLIVMRLLDLFWLVIPAFHPTGLHVHWLDLVAPAGVGGVWMALYVWQLQERPLLPLHELRWQQVPEHE
jgi:hypothetical protein